jgi:general secretion pathway protein D
MVTDLESALQLDADGALTGAVKVVPIEQANAVMVITRQPDYLDRVAKLIEHLEQVKQSAGRTVHIYRPKNTQPTDLQPILQRAFNPSGGGAQDDVAPGNLPPTAAPARLGSVATGPASAGGGGAAQSGGAASQGMGGAASGAASAAAQKPAEDAPQQQQSGGGDPKGPQIIADRINGALIVLSTDSEYQTIEAAIRQLDVLPMQVLVEATIAEVSLTNELQYGVQFFLQNGEGQVGLSNALSSTPTTIDPKNPVSNASLFPGVLAPNYPGLAVVRPFGDVQVALQALRSITDVQIVSAPKLLILDRQQASFQVGDMVPTITQSATSVITAGAPVVNNVQYQPTGVILNVTPRINSGGLVTLEIEQEVSDVVPTTTSSINSPTFQQRRIKTKVIVQDGETISLAGLISDKKTKGNSGVPLLQEIPVLGTLFSTKLNNRDRTELLVLLTPHVVHDQREARALTEELKRKLAPSSILP